MFINGLSKEVEQAGLGVELSLAICRSLCGCSMPFCKFRFMSVRVNVLYLFASELVERSWISG